LSPQARAVRAQQRAATETEATGRRLTFTTRAAVLALVFCAVLVTLAYPLKQYLDQRSQIRTAAAQERSTEQRVKQLTTQHQQAQQPAVVEEQARQRLHYTLPGQQNYIVLQPVAPARPAIEHTGHAKVPLDPGSTWYDRLWDSTVVAGKG
jgi:cell division protein FtsB